MMGNIYYYYRLILNRILWINHRRVGGRFLTKAPNNWPVTHWMAWITKEIPFLKIHSHCIIISYDKRFKSIIKKSAGEGIFLKDSKR